MPSQQVFGCLGSSQMGSCIQIGMNINMFQITSYISSTPSWTAAPFKNEHLFSKNTNVTGRSSTPNQLVICSSTDHAQGHKMIERKTQADAQEFDLWKKKHQLQQSTSDFRFCFTQMEEHVACFVKCVFVLLELDDEMVHLDRKLPYKTLS